MNVFEKKKKKKKGGEKRGKVEKLSDVKRSMIENLGKPTCRRIGSV